MRRLFNDGWQFARAPLGEIPAPADFRPVDIPHDWQIYDVKNLYATGDGWYRKKFSVKKTPRNRFSLRFEGVYMDSEVYLNGVKIFEWKYGYTPFVVPLDNISDGENEISVRVRYQCPNTRWYSGAGIYRDVTLIETGENRIAEDGTYVVSSVEGRNWRTEIDTELECNQAGILKHTLYDADGEIAAEVKTPFPEGTKKLTQSFEINPILWSTDEPYLYSLLTELFIGDERVDERFERIGYKFVRFDPNNGFFLNGKSMKLNGACMHHDLGALGSAFNSAALRRQLVSLKEMGVNAIRTSHNPSMLPELCDELGILLDSEFTDMWELKKTDYDYSRFFTEWHERDVRAWVRRERNHPSIVMWSIGNEIYDTHASPHGVEITKELSRCVRIDDYKCAHPITIGSNYMRWEGAQNCAEEIDLVGYNYTESIYDEHHKKHPHWIIYGSETASTIQSRGIYHFPADVFSTTYDDLQCSSLMNCATGWGAQNVEYNIIEDRIRRFSLGQFIWTGWDYIGEPTPYSTKNSYFGHSDTAGFPKDSYYAYKAEWNRSAPPFVHLFPNWDWNEGQMIDLFIYSNCCRSELFVNGVSMGSHIHDHEGGGPLSGRWRVPYHKGEIRAVGYNERGEAVCEQVRRTPGDPAKIVLKSDKTTLFANGEDMAFVEVTVVDRDGNPVDNARNRINVSVKGAGRLMGLDNGDSTDYEEYKTSSRRLFAGKLLIMLAASGEAGTAELTVSSPKLPDEKLTLRAIPARIREGASFGTFVPEEPAKSDVSVRKIELTVSAQKITPEAGHADVTARLLPEYTTFSGEDVFFKATTDSGVETNLIEIEKTPDGARLMPRGNGKYRLRAYCKNGGSCEEVISEIEMENCGFGPASVIPYGETVCASLCSNPEENQSAMGGGVLTSTGTPVRFDRVDFGAIGSDEITIGIYTYNENVIPVRLTDGGKVLTTLDFQAKNEWNTYKYNTFRLPEKLKGIHEIAFEFGEELRFKGFSFAAPRRAGVKLSALENDGVYGDSYRVGESMIEGIGNNVSVTFGGIELGGGVSRVKITGRTRNARDTVHLRFSGGEARIIEFDGSPEPVTRSFEIAPVSGTRDLSVVFLPGCDFDFGDIRFGE